MLTNQPTSYIFTWKSRILPHAEIVKIIASHIITGNARYFWRCANHDAPVGSVAFFLSQEPKFRGIFAVGKITQKPKLMPDTIPGANSFRAEIEFDQIHDPYEYRLIEFEQLIKIRPINEKQGGMHDVPRQWRPRQSGEKIDPYAALEIKKIFDKRAQHALFQSNVASLFDPNDIEDARERIIREITARRGQKKFRDDLLSAYGNQCAITGCAIPELLEAAHIFPYFGRQTDCVQNGIILRSDIHTLFDLGLVAIDSEKMQVIVSKKIDDNFYKNLLGKKLDLPRNKTDHPSTFALDDHRKRHSI